MKRVCSGSVSAGVVVMALALGGTARGDVGQLQKDFQSPPDDGAFMVRWWWLGPAVDKPGIDRELAAMKAGGIGGFEVQPTYPLVLDNAHPPVKNLRWMSPEFLEMLGYTAAKAKAMGMRFDLTLGSGWPYGGPMFNQQTDGTKRLESQVVQVAAGQTTVQATVCNVFAAFAGPADAAGGGEAVLVAGRAREVAEARAAGGI